MILWSQPVSGRGGRLSALRNVWVAIGVIGFAAFAARGDDGSRLKAKGEAPPHHLMLSRTPGGAFFVAESLKERYNKALERVKGLQADLDAERIDGTDALKELESLQADLKELREEINQKKVLVSAAKVHRQSETTLFDVGPGRSLVITADDIKVRGWDGPQVKCVLEKTVLAVDDKPVDEQLKGLKVVHRFGPAPDVVGRPAAELEAEEKKFLASPEGQKLDDKGRARRRQLIQEINGRFDVYRAFQGKGIDVIQIEGLTSEQGNQWISIDFPSPGGGGTFTGEWQRNAALTVYVPACEAVALRGCQVGLDVEGARASVILTSHDSHDRQYDGKFAVRDLHGSLTARDTPLDVVEDIHGNVSIRSTAEMADSSTSCSKGQRTLSTSTPRALTCRNIEGDLTAWFMESSLKLEAIGGRIDVRNEFGDTTLAAGSGLAKKAHRILSEAGRIEVQTTPQALKDLPLLVLTNCGSVRTNADQDVLRDFNVTLSEGDPAGVSRGWRGLASGPDSPGGIGFLKLAERVGPALEGKDRPAGLDLISRGGSLRVMLEEKR